MQFASRVAAQDGLHPCLTMFTSVIIIIPLSEVKGESMNAKKLQEKMNEWKLNTNGEEQMKL